MYMYVKTASTTTWYMYMYMYVYLFLKFFNNFPVTGYVIVHCHHVTHHLTESKSHMTYVTHAHHWLISYITHHMRESESNMT